MLETSTINKDLFRLDTINLFSNFNKKSVGKYPFLGAFAKLREVNNNFMSVRPSVRLAGAWNSSAPTGRIFVKFDI